MLLPRAAAGLLLTVLALLASTEAGARTVYRCVQGGTVSLATAPEPGSKCVAKEIDDNAVSTPNLWGSMGVFSGTLYEREQEGQKVYSTRNLPGSTPYLKFTVQTPRANPRIRAWAVSASRVWIASLPSSRRRRAGPGSTTPGCAPWRMPKATSMPGRCRPRARWA